MSQIGLKSNSLIKVLKDVAVAEGLGDKADFGSLDAQVQQVTNEYQRLYRIILSGGKPTKDELQRIKVETQGLQQTVNQLVKSGIVPANSETSKLLKVLSSDMLGKGGNSIKQLTQIMKAMTAEEEKAKQKAQELGNTSDTVAKKGMFSWLNFFNIFKRGPTDIKAVDSSLKSVDNTVKQTSGLVEGLKFTFAGLTGGLIGGGIVSTIPAVFDALKNKVTGAIQAASDAAEEMSKFGVVFDSTTDSARGFDDSLVQGVMATLDNMAVTLGRSKYELRNLAATFQDTFVPLGFGREEAAKLSISVTELAEDLSSFYNLSEKEVGDSLSSFLVGNYENARKFGSVVTDARLDAEILKLGIEGGTEAVDLQTKALVALRLLYNDTSDAQGDALYTAAGFANQLRTLQGQAKDSAIEFGQKLLPFANLLLSAFLRFKNEIGPSIANIFNGATAAVTPFVNALSTILSGGSIDEIFSSLQIAVGNVL
ncbi:MAG: hypothetical protein HC874_31210 [Richelia sp. SL_2_1]|nr:hypothetical protein [Richelia sp. SL_2_1]